MKLARRIFIVIIGTLCFNSLYAQGGGPPMMTDDPGIVDLHKWEINTSVNTSITNETQLSVPYVDANYGIAHNLQLKAEAPYLITIDKQKHSTGALGPVLLGVKFRFMDEDKNFVSVGTYPQFTITTNQKGLLLPLLLEKNIGKFVIGEDIGNFFGEHNYNSLQNGTLLGYKVTGKLQLLGEYFLEKTYGAATGTDGFMNYGFRYTLNPTFTLMGSFGTQVVTDINEQRQYFFSFLGLQSDF